MSTSPALPCSPLSNAVLSRMGFLVDNYKTYRSDLQRIIRHHGYDKRKCLQKTDGNVTDFVHVTPAYLAGGQATIDLFWENANLAVARKNKTDKLHKLYHRHCHQFDFSDNFKNYLTTVSTNWLYHKEPPQNWATLPLKTRLVHLNDLSQQFDNVADPHRQLVAFANKTRASYSSLSMPFMPTPENDIVVNPVTFPHPFNAPLSYETEEQMDGFKENAQLSRGSFCHTKDIVQLHCHDIPLDPFIAQDIADDTLHEQYSLQEIKMISEFLQDGQLVVEGETTYRRQSALHDYKVITKVIWHEKLHQLNFRCYDAYQQNADAVSLLTGFTPEDAFLTRMSDLIYHDSDTAFEYSCNRLETLVRDVMILSREASSPVKKFAIH